MTPHERTALLRLRSDHAWLRVELAALRVRLALRRKYSADQPRVPAGNPDGGQWTGDGGNERWRRLADRARWATGRGRAPTRVRINERWHDLTPGQAARLQAAEAEARDALRQVRQRDPEWRPSRSLTENVEGHIQAVQAEAREAQARLAELQRVGIGPGRFAAESVPARGPGRDFTASERREINRIGRETGCHTCGTQEPGTRSNNFVPDHQLPNARNIRGRPQRLYPQCLSCSQRQGGWMTND